MGLKAFNATAYSVGVDNLINVIDSGGNITAQTLLVNVRANLGSVGNLTITGSQPGQVLQATESGNLTFANIEVNPAGSNTQIQFNDAESLGASANLTFNKATDTLSVKNSINIGGADANISGANNVIANFYFGDGGFLSNVSGSGNTISSGSSNVKVYESGNVAISVNGVSNTALFTTSNNFYTLGNIGVNSNAFTAQLTLDNNLGPKIDFYYDQSGDGDRYGINLQSSQLRIFSGGGPIAAPNGGISFGKANSSTFTESMRIQNDGNVGIGTSTPNSFVTIEKNAGGDYLDLTIRNLSTANDPENQSRMRLSTAGDSVEGVVFGKTYNSGPYGGFAYMWNTENADTVLATNNTERMRILANGNVGIGVNNPGSKLEVNGSFAATDKSFVIKHPTKENMKLRYGSLESPYHGVRLTGQGEIVNGSATIVLPDYISALVKEEGINIQLTNIDHNKVLWVKAIDLANNLFVVGGPRSLFKKTYQFYWSFTAIRKDIPDLVTEYKENKGD